MFNYFFELKVRIIYSCLFYFLLICISFLYKESLLYFLVEPSKTFNKTLQPYFIYTNLTEVFSTYLEMVLLVFAYFTIPFLFYQCWLFFQPGLYKKEVLKLRFFLLILLFNYCFVTYFLYNPILFWSWGFFASFETRDVDIVNLYFEAKLNEYFDFLFNLYFYMGFLLQCFFTAFANLFFFIKEDVKKVVIIRKYFYIAIVIIAALITPPDIISQIILVTPIIFCYELFLMTLFLKKEYLKS